jgi:drug/metabolite transporter (DMT)-like permease
MSINIQESISKMPLGEKIIVPAAIVLLIDSFLPWYHASVGLGVLGSVSVNRSGWQSPGALWSILALLAAVAMAVVIVLQRFTAVKLPALPQGLTWARVQAALAGIAVLGVLIKLINHSSDLGFGFFIGIICVAALAAGAGLLFQAEREGGGGSGSTM